MMVMRYAVLALVVGGVLCGGAWARHDRGDAAFRNVEAEDAVSSVAWAVPLKGGALRAVLIAPQWGARDAATLAQSIDLDYEIRFTWDSSHLGGQAPGVPPIAEADAKRAILDGLSGKLDVIVIGNIDFAVIPDDIADAIASRVKAGAGLVVARYGGGVSPGLAKLFEALKPAENAAAVTRGVGEKLTPEWVTGLGFVKASTLDKGRVVELNYAEGVSRSHFLVPPLLDPLRARDEHIATYFSLAARALRWAAGREPSIWVQSIEEVGLAGPKEDEIPPGLPDEYVRQMKEAAVRPDYQSYAIKLNYPADDTYRVVAQVREPGRGVCISFPNLPPLRKGAASYTLDVPVGPGGYFLDLWLMDKAKVVEWHTEAITVKGWPEIENLSYSKGYLLPNDSLAISLDVRPRLANPRPCVVLARATDSIGRTVSENTVGVEPQGGSIQISMRFADLMANLVKVEIFAAAPLGARMTRFDLDRAAYSHMYLPVRVPHREGAFELAVMAGGVEEYNARASLRTLAELGVDTVALTGYAEGDSETLPPALDAARFSLARLNLRAVPEVARCVPPVVENDSVFKPCPSDPSFVNHIEKSAKLLAPAFWVAGSSVFSLGHTCVLSASGQNLCQCAACLEGFRAMLRQQYDDLAALNQAWGASFADWDAVQPPTLAAARESGHPAGWLDFRAYMDTMFAATLLRAEDCVRGLSREVYVGFGAAPKVEAHQGQDWTILAPETDAVFAPFSPDSVFPEIYRGLSPARRYGALLVDGVEGGQPGWLPWYAAVKGFGALWVKQGLEGTALTPGGHVTPAFGRLCESVAELRGGLDALLAASTRAKPEVGVYLSSASQYLSQAIPVADALPPTAATEAMVGLIRASGRDCGFVTRQQAIQGKLRDFAVVALPMARALADDEVKALRAFVDEGGALVADWMPGDYDVHGVARTESPFGAVFGVSRKAPSQASSPCTVKVTVPVEKGSVSGEATQAMVDSGVSVEGGVACGAADGAPVWVIQGKCLLLNAVAAQPLAGLASPMERYLESAGAARSCPLAEPPARLDAQQLRYGDARIYVALRASAAGDGPRKAELVGEPALTYYDLRAGGRLAKGKRVGARLGADGAAVVAGLGYEVRELGVQTLDRVAQGRRLPMRFAIRAEKGKTVGRHLVHVTLSRAGGEVLSHYDRDVDCPGGQGDTYIPLALDEVPGLYTIRGRDVLTGISVQKSVNIVVRNP